MAGGGTKQKRKIWFAGGIQLRFDDYKGVKMPCPWSPGKVNTKKKKIVVINFKGLYKSKGKITVWRRKKPRSYKNRAL